MRSAAECALGRAGCNARPDKDSAGSLAKDLCAGSRAGLCTGENAAHDGLSEITIYARRGTTGVSMSLKEMCFANRGRL